MEGLNWDIKFSEKISSVPPSEIREVLKVISQSDIISFAGGVPDPSLFPLKTLENAFKCIISDPNRFQQALQYAKSEGYDPLRAKIAKELSSEASSVTQDSILITSGAQQGLDLLGKTLINPSSRIIVTHPTYLGAVQTFSLYQPCFVSVKCDQEGIILEDLEAELLKGAAFVYLIPDFQNPTGLTFSINRRKAIVELSIKYGVPIIEDAAYRSLNYNELQLPTLISYYGTENNIAPIIHLGTVSKIVAPGLRIGWIATHHSLIERLTVAKQADDLFVNIMNQMVLEKVLDEGIDSHLASLRAIYRERRDVMLRALSKYMPKEVSWTKPNGGFFIWLTLPSHLNGRTCFAQAIEKAQVAVVPGQSFYADKSVENTVRLSFSTNSIDKIEEGIHRLAQVIYELC